MLRLVESKREKIALSRRLKTVLVKAWPQRERRLVGWRPRSMNLDIAHNGVYWFTSVPPESDNIIPRYWNSFGKYSPKHKLPITVEINIATTSNDGRISGFFARDEQTGVVCLMHDGGVGGGKPGVSKKNYLAWTQAEQVPVRASNGDVRRGILITQLDGNSAGRDIARFVQNAIDFKEAVDAGYKGAARQPGDADDVDDYYDEFSGKKKRKRMRELEYISRHGDIVRALRDWRKLSKKSGEKLTKTGFIDLGVKVRGELTEIYEVKSGCYRQYIYAAIGQLLVHEADSGASKRFLVLPDDDEIAPDLSRALSRNEIRTIRFHLDGDAITIMD
jgi:hypothetical protein